MAFEPKLPPSLNRPWGAPASEKDARQLEVEKAMHSLPLTDEAKLKVSSFVSAFETTYYHVKREQDDRPASAALVQRQLSDMARRCDKLEGHFRGMHRDAIRAWAAAGGAVGKKDALVDVVSLSLLLNTAAEWAKRALTINKAVRHAAKRGNPGNAMAAAMRDTAEFVYTRLTGRRPGRTYDTYENKERDTEFTQFLRHIYKAYDVRASARSRVRRRRRVMGKNSKK
jgi:hypothetical protein